MLAFTSLRCLDFSIFLGKKVTEAYVINTVLSDDYSLAVSMSAYYIDKQCLHLLRHIDCHSTEQQVGKYCMLIMDGYGSHYMVEFIGSCKNTTLYPFVGHQTQFSSCSFLTLSISDYLKRHAVILCIRRCSCAA
jgi:hypothetical protein